MRPWPPWEVKFCECRKSPNSVPFVEAVKFPHISQPLSVWPFSMLLYWQVWTHPRSLCSLPVHSLSVSLNDSQEQKNPLLSCSLFTFSSLLFLPFCSIFVSVKLGLVKAQATYFWDKQSHSESLQVSRDSCQVCGFFSFLFLLGEGKRM